MFQKNLRGRRSLLAVGLAIGLFVASFGGASAHSRYDHSDPVAGSVVDGTPFVLHAYFSQELMKASTLQVMDDAGTQVDLGDGHVDLDDPDRKVMLVSLPDLQEGVYTVHWTAQSAEDGHTASGHFTFGVGIAPPDGGVPVNDPDPSDG
jgi:methionine-rich copper-binding protein CopC